MTLQDYFKYAAARLKAAGYHNCAFEARALISQVLEISDECLISSYTRPLNIHENNKLEDALERRCKYEPLAKIVGQKEFWGLPFKVNRYTLDPRPDSETLIEAVLKSFNNQSEPLRILELGTGSGCLILSLLHELHNAKGLAVDISDKALDLALQNVQQLGLSDRCSFKKSNWFENISGEFDIIISNPPYIPENQLEKLGYELKYDPRSALTPGPTGLESYKFIMESIREYMMPHARAFFEIGFDQYDSVSKIVEEKGFFVRNVHKDLSERPRVIEFNM